MHFVIPLEQKLPHAQIWSLFGHVKTYKTDADCYAKQTKPGINSFFLNIHWDTIWLLTQCSHDRLSVQILDRNSGCVSIHINTKVTLVWIKSEPGFKGEF